MSARQLNSVLVANRGEIACRVMRTAKDLGLTTVAVHSATDRDARHCREADLCVDLGGSKAADSYLKIDKIIAAAHVSGAQAIHPGYGFLSENAGFARAVEAAGLIFLGPPASAIEAMGSKSAAKALMERAGVPLVPGYHGEDQDLETFRVAAERIGYPVLLKATAGGGGKGMKVVENVTQLAEGLGASPVSVSQQLMRLRAEGIVTTRREGKSVYYHLANAEVAAIVSVLRDTFCRIH